MAFLVVNKFSYPTGAPDANDVYPGVSSTWGDDGAGVLNNGTIAFPTAAGGAGQVLTDVGGTGVLTFADAPSTPPSGILGSVQLSDGAGGFTSDQPSFNYNSTTKRLGIGKVATTSLDVLHDDIDVNALLENVSASFDEIAVGLKLKHRSTNSMDPGLGISQEYYIEDDTSGELLAGSITFQRQSADALRKFVVKGGTNGTQELFSIDSNREFTIEGGLRSGFGFGFTPPDNSLAWNINNAGASVIIGNGGSGIGLRVLANSGNILSLEDSSQAVQASVSSVGLVTFNAAANATADVEVKAENIGTATYTDVSERKFSVGTDSPLNPLHIFSDGNGVPILSHAKGTSTNSLFLAADFRHTTIADMVDDFATGFRFQIEDSANVVNTIASVYARRDGADNEGKLEFLAGTNGTEVGLTINSDLVIDVAQNFSRLTMVTDTSSVHSIDRENATNSASIKSSLRLKTKSAGASPVDGFGSGMFFMIEDLGGTAEVIGQIGFSKDGALNKGALEIKGGTDGAEPFLTIDASGKTTFNEAALSGGDFEVKAQTTGTATYTDVSAKQMVIGSNTSFVNADLMLDNGGYLGLKETTTPTATASYAKVYTKNDNKLYFQDGAGTEHELAFV